MNKEPSARPKDHQTAGRASDTPAVARRREREKRVISYMICLYCSKHHAAHERTHVAHCGERVCPDCLELDSFAVKRTERCPNMATKTSCNKCAHPCYPAAMRNNIRSVMRYAGPRMIYTHPLAAIRHLLGK